jgi:multidrug transporter EmrE-like cation transporter
MAWVYLVMAGLFEIGFATALKQMDGHKNIPWSIAFYICIISSFFFLEKSLKTIPIGTAYAIWTGIGGVGVATIGILFMGDPATPLRIGFLVLLIAALVGLKFTAVH